MKFIMDGRDEPLTVKTDSGAEVSVYFKLNGLDYAVVEEREFEAADDSLNTFYVMIGGKAHSIRQVMLEALKQYPDAYDEMTERNKEVYYD